MKGKVTPRNGGEQNKKVADTLTPTAQRRERGRTTLYLDKEYWQLFGDAAHDERMSRSQLLDKILGDYLRQGDYI